MSERKLKYLEQLQQFPNCPPQDFKEINLPSFRWIHNPPTENDFKPLNVIGTPPPRMLDSSDSLCMGYGLSMYISKEFAVKKYKGLYEKKRNKQKLQFIEDKGNYVAMIPLIESDGIAGSPNSEGHFTFHEYEGSSLIQKIMAIEAILE